jgi:Sulfotransferase family
MGKLYLLKRKLERRWKVFKNKRIKPNKDAIWVFGMQKAGTTAIAALLAHRANKKVSLDTPLLWQPYLRQIKNHEIDFSKHVKKNPYWFSKDILKEPTASLLIKEIEKVFYLKKYVFIIRNPFDLIRSILDRLNLPGNKINVDEEDIDKNWRYLLNNGENYIEKLAEEYVEVYSQLEYIENNQCVLVKYEDFVKDKIYFINQLCDDLYLQKRQSIDDLKDKNFQPKGEKVDDYLSFFGNVNYKIINDICSQIINQYYSG